MRRFVSAPEADNPPPQWEQLERLAREGLTYLSAGDGPDCIALRAQLSSAKLVEIDYTGAGFFIAIDTSPTSPKLSRDGVIGDVHAISSAGVSPLGFLLFVSDGSAVELEVFGLGDWPSDLTEYRCRYVRWRRQPDGSAVAEDTTKRDMTSMWE